MASGSGVTVDTSDLERGMRQLADGLDRAGSRVAMRQAQATAQSIAGNVPVLTGRLRATVGVVSAPDGAAVTYGGELPYAWKIERSTQAVEDGLAGCDDDYHQAMTDAAEKEVRRL